MSLEYILLGDLLSANIPGLFLVVALVALPSFSVYMVSVSKATACHASSGVAVVRALSLMLPFSCTSHVVCAALSRRLSLTSGCSRVAFVYVSLQLHHGFPS